MRLRAYFLATSVIVTAMCGQARAADDDPDIVTIRRQLEQQAKAIAEQQQQLRRQQEVIDALETKLSRSAAGQATPAADTPRDAGPAPPSSPPAVAQSTPAVREAASQSTPTQVGEAPPQNTRPPQIQTIASVGGVLTPKGTFTIEPYTQYVHTSLNQFTFEGVQIIDAFLIGVINAGRTQQDLGLIGATARYGITDRLEVEARVPFVYRAQSLTGTLLNSSNQVLSRSAHGSGIGDLEVAFHYQINDGQEDWPFFIANLRYKDATGVGPWDVEYDRDGSARTLPTGSGFSVVNPSLTVLYPADPAVLYANAGWTMNFQNSKTLTINNTAITDIHPGDTYSGSFGLAVSLNETVSFSLGYQQDYIEATTESLNGARVRAQSFLSGQLAMGLTLKTSDENTFNVGMNFGVTRDAPDVSITLRTPFSFTGL